MATPLLVHVPGADEPLQFGAAWIDAPPFRHWIRTDCDSAIKRIQKWKCLVPTACFDEWIANPDRHPGNLLHDGKSNFWLIDHDQSLAVGQPDDAMCESNVLMKIAALGMDALSISTRLWPQVNGTLHSYHDAPLDRLARSLTAQALDSCDMLMTKLSNRQANLPALGSQRLPRAQGELFNGPAT